MIPGFHRIFMALFLALVVLRFYWHGKARVWSKEHHVPEGRLITFLRLFVALPLFALVGAYLFNPRVLAWAEIPMPAALRWAGAVLALAGLVGGAWVHHHLGLNFSPYLRIRDTHRLITSGPYRWVRHPMYTAFFTLFIGYLLLTRNVVIAGMGLLTLTIVMIVRTPKEEQMLLERFGEEYRAYMARTGRYWPKLAFSTPQSALSQRRSAESPNRGITES